jgi:hypothetical protein
MQRLSATVFAVVVLGVTLPGTTLQQLPLDEMIRKSTTIVRGKVRPTVTSSSGSVVYTHYNIQVSEQWKGSPASSVDVAVPGGTSNGKRQTYAGTPVFTESQDYVFFLWTSKSGLTQVIGLSQGLFSITSDPSGTQLASRSGSSEQMLDAAGKPVNDFPLSMPLPDLKSRVARVLANVKGGL